MDRLTHGRQLFNDSETQVYYNRLKEYEDLEEQGLLVKSPCQLGDTVYYVDDDWGDDGIPTIEKTDPIRAILIKSDGIYIQTNPFMDYDKVGSQYALLTRKDAEEFIKNMKTEHEKTIAGVGDE